MKIKKIISYSLVFLSLFTGITTTVYSQIASGTYIIGTGGNYTTINAAITDLTTNGLAGDGHVVFKIKDGTYDEQLLLGAIAGTSATSTVTFVSESEDAEKVLIQFSGNFIISLDGADFVTFKHIKFYNYSTGTYIRTIYSNSVSSNITLNNCILIGPSNYSTSNSYAHIYFGSSAELDYFTADSCQFLEGSDPICTSSSISPISDEVVLSNNTMSTFDCIWAYKMNKIKITNNTINVMGGDNGIYLNNCDGAIVISGNKLYKYNSSGTQYGIRLEACDGSFVYPGLISNNFITVDVGNTSQVMKGIWTYNSTYQKFYNNSIFTNWAGVNSYCFYADGGSNITLKNNILCNQSLGYALGSSASTNIASDYNDLYSAGNNIAVFGTTYVKDLTQLKALGFDTHSISAYPSFVSKTDLHVKTPWLNNVGVTLTEVTTDIEGEARGGSPDIGADEFTPYSTSKYSGTVTVDKTGAGDFVSLKQAVDTLLRYGVSGALTVEFASETYNENVLIREIPGASATNRITFVSAAQDSTAVNIQYSSSSESDNYLVCLYGADYITFKQMTFNAAGTTYGKVVNMFGYSHDNNLENNVFNGSGWGTSYDDRTIVVANLYRTDNLTIRNNVFNNGGRSIRLQGVSTTDNTTGLLIKNNEFIGTYRNINLENFTSFEISNNTMNEFTDAGIGLYNCLNPLLVNANKLSSTSSGSRGMYLNTCTGISYGVISNNFISLVTSSQQYALSIESSQYQKIYYNSVYIVGSSTYNRAFSNTSSSNVTVKNNNFIINGNGYAYYNDNATGIVASDYNNLFTKGTYIGYWGNASAQTFSDFKMISSSDANSMNVNPAFVSNTDLHTNSYWIDNKGTSISGITKDIDGETRSGTTPDIGADEYTSTNIPLEGTYTIGAGGDYTTVNLAVTDLINKGITGPVTFNILAGIYNEQVALSQITGANANDTIVFQSATGNPDDVIISYNGGSSNNYIILLNGADYIIIKNLKFQADNSEYSRIIVLNGNAQNNTIIGNKFQGRTTYSSSHVDAIILAADNPIIHNTKILNNTFSNGSFALYLTGNNTSYSESLKVINNTSTGAYQNFAISYFSAPQIENNNLSFIANDGYGIGISLYSINSSATDGLKILNNTINSDQNAYYYGAIYLNACDATSTVNGLLANNTIYVSSSGKTRSRGINIYDSDYITILYNTVNINCESLDDQAFYCSSSNYLTITNNIFSIRGDYNSKKVGAGYAFYIKDGASIFSDYNNYYSPGRYPFYWLGTSYQNLDELKGANGNDAYSQHYFPALTSTTNLTPKSPWLNGKGSVSTLVTTDKLGIARDITTPDLGAYEFSTSLTPFPGGTLTLGSTGDIPSFDSLANYLLTAGISGPTTVDIMDGSYSCHIVLKDIPGVTSSDTVLVKSQSGNPSLCTLGYTQGLGENYIIYLNGTDYITIKDLSFSSGGTSYSNIIRLNGNSNNVNILNNIFNGITAHSSKNIEKASIYAEYDHIVDKLLVSGNTFNNNSIGVYFDGKLSYPYQKILITQNTFNNQYNGLYAYYTNNISVINNRYLDTYNISIYLNYCDEAIRVLNNRIETSYEDFYAIYLLYCDGIDSKPGLIANNFVKAGNTSNLAYGIKLDYSTFQKVYYNSVNVTGNMAFHNWGGGNNSVYNNIFANNKTGNVYAYSTNTTGGIALSDYNELYSAGNYIAGYNGTSYTTLAAFQAASGKDANSKNIKPVFASATDLHLFSEDLMGLATPFAEVTKDIDGNSRDPYTPDIGADEIYCITPTLNVPDVTNCQYSDLVVSNLSTGIAAGSKLYWDFNGDGTNDDTTLTVSDPVTYMFQQAGNYTAKLTVKQLGGCEDFINFGITVNAKPAAPVSEDIEGCSGNTIPDLTATGQGLIWYSDADLTTQVGTGETFASEQTEVGTYIYYVTQTVLGCESDATTDTLTIGQSPEAPDAENVALCFGAASPTLTATGTDIKWYAEEGLTTLLISASEYNPGVTAVGKYTYYVTQTISGCESPAEIVTLTIHPTPTLSATITDIDCQSHPFGTIDLTVSSGTEPFIYQWSNGKTYEDITNLEAGTYSVTVKDYNGCEAESEYTIDAPVPLVLTMITNDAECTKNTGSATVSVSGGEEPYDYRWNTGDSTATISSLYSGIYVVTVTDNLGCKATSVATIDDLGSPEITENTIQSVSCYGLTDGAISLTITGGVTPYTISWSNGATTEDINELEAGPYEIQVVDASGCKAAKSITITQPDAINIVLDILESTCGQANGSATANVTGGTSPYTYLWSTTATTTSISNLAKGVYNVKVTDNNSCEATKSFGISELGAPTVIVDSVFQGTCGNSDGAIYISVYGTATEFTYLWSDGSTD